MSWLDDFTGTIQDFTESEGVTTIAGWIQDNPGTVNALVKIAEPQGGNQSAAQIASGRPGYTAPVAGAASQGTAASGALSNSIGSGLFANGRVLGISAPMIILLGVGAYFLLRKKRA